MPLYAQPDYTHKYFLNLAPWIKQRQTISRDINRASGILQILANDQSQCINIRYTMRKKIQLLEL